MFIDTASAKKKAPEERHETTVPPRWGYFRLSPPLS